MSRTEKNWGYEELIHNGAYCMKLLVYTRKLASSLHYHERKHESFYIASGIFEVQIGIEGADSATTRVRGVGEHIVLPPRTLHRVRCIEPGVIVEASTRDDPDDCVRLVPSEALKCPECGTELLDAPGIGYFCPKLTCPVSDDDLRWPTLTEEQKAAERAERLEECRRYKADGHPSYQDLDL